MKHRSTAMLAGLTACLGFSSIVYAASGDARWVKHVVSGTGTTEAQACEAAQAKASAHARDHLGLNIGRCRCLPAAKGQLRQCRLDYEVLQKA